MKAHLRKHPLPLAQSLTLLCLALLVQFTDDLLIRGGISIAALCLYHLVADRFFQERSERGASGLHFHLGSYLILCSITVWSTTPPNDESAFWLVYLLPVSLAASRLGLAGTLLTCALSGLTLFVFSLPVIFRPELDVEELAEILSFSLSFFVVGILVQFYSSQTRRRLQRERELNEELRLGKEQLEHSLSELHRTRETLRRKEALAALGELSARLAHEIRNPLGVITSSAELLDRRTEDPRAHQLLEIIQEEGTRLNSLISDFLTFGRPLPPKLQRFEIASLVRSSLAQINELAQKRQIRLSHELPDIDIEILADPDMVRQILLNLLLNAMDATGADGSIRVSLEATESQVRIAVEDDGCGIPPRQCEQIFNPFFTTKDKGTGLGLSNAYKMAEAQGGDLLVQSEPGEGALFTLVLPRKEP